MNTSSLAFLSLLCAPLCAAAGGGGVADLYASGDEVGWSFERDGERIGFHVFRYEGPLDAPGPRVHRFSGRVHVEPVPALGIPRQRYLGELFTDDQGHPLRQVLEVELGESYSRVELTVSGGAADIDVLQGQRARRLRVDVPADAFLQANNFIGYFELMLALSPFDEDGTLALSLLSSNAVRVLPYSAKRVDGRIEDSFGQLLTLDDDGRLLVLEAPQQKLVVARSDERFETFTIVRPRPAPAARGFDVEPVVVRHGDVALAGEITRPTGAKGRLPAVFFLSGSGGQDRDGGSAGLDLGTHEILDRLTKAGFLVLRVDDRGVGESTGPTEGMSLVDLVADARACVDFLFARDDVDPARVALIGHSEGGISAPILWAERPQVAALVLMAGTGRPMIEVMLEQNGQALDAQGIVGLERERKLAEIRHWLERAASDAPLARDEVPDEYRALLPARAWLQSHARVDPLANVQRVRCPVLILQGAMDFQVSAERDARVLAAALDAVEHADHRLVVFDRLDHLFKRVAGEESTLAEYFTRRSVDAEFQDVLCAWLGERLLAAEPR